MDNLVPLLSVLLFQAPVLIVWTVGLVLAIVFWKRHPKVSLLALIAILGLMITSILGSLLRIWLGAWMDQFGAPFGRANITLVVYQVASSLISAVFWALLVFAIFGWRKKPEVSQ